MNRFATALSAAIPSSGSEAGSSAFARESRTSSPLDSSFSAHRPRSKSPANALLYDDPRSTYYETTSNTKWDPANYPQKPGLLRAHTDERPQRTVSPSPGPGTRTRKESYRTVRANVLANRKSGGRVGAMAKGPDGKYAVGGGMALKIVQVTQDSSGTSTPRPSDPSPNRKSQKEPQVLAKGPGGVTVTEVVNLWRGSMAVGKGVNDVNWGTGSFAHKVVTASPSGNFLIFDVNRGKLEREVSGGHPRPMNVLRLCQTSAHAHLLITGGTDGHSKLWDLRERDPTTRKYFKHSGAVTSLCFSPDDPHQFVVGLENGAIQRYDLRHQKNGRVWGAHGSKAVLDLQWKEGDGHMSGNGWLASGGADRTVQVWDMSQSWDQIPTPVHTLHTAYPLRRVAWRPQHATEIAIVPMSQQSVAATLVDPSIASVSQGLGQESVTLDEDSHIEIWDVRRHHIAKYALPTIDGAAVEAAWSDENCLVTAYQNGMFGQLDMRYKTIPLDSVPRQVMSWSSHGEMAYGIDRFKQGEIPFDDPLPEYTNHWDKLGQKQKDPADPPYEPLQAIGTMYLPVFDNDEFSYLANHYRIEGGKAEELCRWNREVATIAGRTDDARCWNLLKHFIEDMNPTHDDTFKDDVFDRPTAQRTATMSPPPSPRERTQDASISPQSTVRPDLHLSPRPIQLQRAELASDPANEPVEELMSASSSSSSSSISDLRTISQPRQGRFLSFVPPDIKSTTPQQESRGSTSTAVPRGSSNTRSRDRSSQLRSRNLHQHSSSSTSEDDSYPDPYGIINERNRQSSTNSAKSSNNPSPRLDPDRRISTIKSVPLMTSNKGSQDHESGSGSGSQRPSLAGSTRPSLAGSARPSGHRGRRDKSGLVPTSQGWMDPHALEQYKEARKGPILEWWRSYVDDGDAQMATTLYLIGSKVIDFPTKQAERVAHSYIEMLEQHRLSIPAAYIRRFANLSSLEVVVGDPGVTHLAYCSRCGKGTGSLEDTGMERHGKRFWHCKSCRLPAKQCAICREGVKGLWMGCGKCRHGGHQACMRSFYLEKPLTTHTGDTADHGLSTIPSHEARDHMPLYGYGSSHDSSTGLAERGRGSDETARSGDERRDTALGWTSCPRGCGCKCRIVPIHRESEDR